MKLRDQLGGPEALRSQAAYVVFAHGSSVESANQAVREVARQAAKLGGWRVFAAAFLEGGKPNLVEAIDGLAARGESRFIVVPYFLTAGLHLQRDLPRLIEQIRTKHEGIEIEVTPPLDGHPAMAAALVDLARRADRAKSVDLAEHLSQAASPRAIQK
jgi:sirohydrochlorin ferrochelatase